RQEEARASIGELQIAQRQADERLSVAQRRLFEAREALEELSRRAAEAGAAHAALVERAGGLALDVQRMAAAGGELEQRGAELDVARATADADLSHLSHTCEDAVNATLDEVVAEIDRLERDGQTTADAGVVIAVEDETDEELRGADGGLGTEDLAAPDAAV